MQVLVKIPDEMYEQIKDSNTIFREDERTCYEAVQNGIPLPKGHGRLGDLDALREEVSSWGMNDYEPSDFIDEIDMADVIIEADKESEE